MFFPSRGRSALRSAGAGVLPPFETRPLDSANQAAIEALPLGRHFPSTHGGSASLEGNLARPGSPDLANRSASIFSEPWKGSASSFLPTTGRGALAASDRPLKRFIGNGQPGPKRFVDSVPANDGFKARPEGGSASFLIFAGKRFNGSAEIFSSGPCSCSWRSSSS